MTIQQWLFSFKGRIGRRDFWIWIATWVVAMLLLFFCCLQRMAEHANGGICAGLFTVANRRRSGETSARSWPLRRMGFPDYSGVDAGGGELVNAALNPPMGGGQTAADGYLCNDGCRTGRVYRHPEREQIWKRYP